MTRRERILLAAVLGVALVVRLAVLLELRGDILFDHPVLDEQRYVDDARAAADGRAASDDDRPYWQPPGILYALRAEFAVAGTGLLLPRLIQVLLSTASCLLLFLIGRRLLGTGVGLGAAAILALHGVVVFESQELLPPTWMLFLDLLALWLLLVAGERRDAGRRSAPALAAGAGLALGASAVFAPTILPFALVAAVWLRRSSLIAALGVGVLLPILPVTLRNHAHGGEWVPVSTNAGLNFYLGNNPDYRDTFALRPGRHWIELDDEPRRHGIERPGEASSYFLRKGLAFWADQPGHAAGLLARKLFLFVHAAEVPRDTDVYAARSSSLVLAALVWPGPVRFPGVLLMPLALAGAVLCWRQRRGLLLLYGFLGVQAVVVPLFFVSARHRVPALAAFALLAAAGTAELVRRVRAARRPAAAAPWAAGVVAGAVLLSLPLAETRMSFAAELDFYRGMAYRERGDTSAALAAFERASTADPHDERFWFERAETLAAARRLPEAVDAWKRAAAADPWDSRPSRRAAQALIRLGDPDGAAEVLQRLIGAAEHEPAHYAPDHLNLVYLHAGRGRTAEAIAALAAAEHADPAYLREHLPGFIAAATSAPGDPALFSALAAAAQRLGLPEPARAAAARAAPAP